MSVFTATAAVIALVFVSVAPVAGAVTHPQLGQVSYSGHQGVARAAERIHLDKTTSSVDDGKKCRRACNKPERNEPAD